MMTRKRVDEAGGGLFLLLLSLFVLNALQGMFNLSKTDRLSCCNEVYIQVSGNIKCPGVYGFMSTPALEEILLRGGGLRPGTENKVFPTGVETIYYESGSSVDVREYAEKIRIVESEMSAFYKMTLEIPISLNDESKEGLTAIPGVGPKIAGAIVDKRTQCGGFRQLDEILSVNGIGPGLYKKMSPYLVL
jgi:DNA uptake protein ComE-like DNA-binding protein